MIEHRGYQELDPIGYPVEQVIWIAAWTSWYM